MGSSERSTTQEVAGAALPFSQNEMVKILTAFGEYEKSAGISNAQRLRAFILLPRYSGLRIGDAVKLSNIQLVGNGLFLYTQKTGTPVNCVLPEFVVRELEKSPKSSEGTLDGTIKIA
jgi:hypothetical protein